MAEKTILDACCGGRMFWFDQQDERAIFQDKRQQTREPARRLSGGMVTFRDIAPDFLVDFRDMPYPDETFWHVIFDPPHFHNGAGASGILAYKYGLLKDTWRDDIRKGFSECFRVLKPNGTLIFKWCETEIPLREVLSLTPVKPMYGHRSGKRSLTHWVAFTKPNTACSGRVDSSRSPELFPAEVIPPAKVTRQSTRR